jgi:hypothetical protein
MKQATELTMYIKNRKIDGIHQRAMTIFDKNKAIIFSDESRIINQEMHKFEKTLIAIKIGLKQFKGLTKNGMVDDSVPIDIFIDSKTIFNWIRLRKCPDKYLEHLEEILLEMSFLTNPATLYYKRLQNKAKYKKTIKDDKESVVDFLNKIN